MNDLLYVCSPYRGDTKRNKEYARKLTRAAINNGFVPVTVHLRNMMESQTTRTGTREDGAWQRE